MAMNAKKVKVIDYRAKQPLARTRLKSARTIPLAPARLTLATLRLYTGPHRNRENNTVQFMVTAGTISSKGIALLKFRIFRDGIEIFNTERGVTFQAIDSKVSGCHTYTLTVENMSKDVTAKLSGPVNFSGLSIRREVR